MLNRIKKLHKQAIVGMNYRNLVYIQGYNSRKYYPNADSKLKSKQLAIENHIPVPELYAVIASLFQVRKIKKILKEKCRVVLKPEHGSGGDGVMIVSFDSDGDIWSGEQKVKFEDIQLHCSNTLAGLYSLGGQIDKVLIEYFVQADPVFDPITYKGVPDIRIVVFKGVPLMAMLRLPTEASQGKANLHQGAIGVGIDMTSGIVQKGFLDDCLVSEHPDTGNAFEGIVLPHWDQILEISAKAYEVFKLGYMGVDIVIDKERGPLLLETNVRPGLAIQLANMTGLKKRLNKVLASEDDLLSLESRIHFAKDLKC